MKQRCRLRSPHAEFECVLSLERLHRDHRSTAGQVHSSRVAIRIHTLDSHYCTCRKKSTHLLPVIRRPECQFQRDIVALVPRHATSSLVAHLARSTLVRLLENVVEPPDAPEACRQGDLRDRQISLIQQSLCKM